MQILTTKEQHFIKMKYIKNTNSIHGKMAVGFLSGGSKEKTLKLHYIKTLSITVQMTSIIL